MGERQRFLLLSILIGLFAGLVVVCFHVSIEMLAWSTVHAQHRHGHWVVLLWPAVGAGISYGAGPTLSVAEFYVTPFDELVWDDPEASVPSSLYPGEIIGLELSVPDYDTVPGELDAFHRLTGASGATWRYAERFADARLLPYEEPDTATGESTWGRLKAAFQW